MKMKIRKILSEFDPVNPNNALKRIIEAGRDGVSVLTDILIDDKEDDEIRGVAAWVLGELEEESAVNTLIDIIIKEPANRIKSQAIWALSKMKVAEAVPYLISMLDNPDIDVRISAAGSLGEIGSEVAIEPLIEALHDEDTRVCDYCCDSLQKIGRSALGQLSKAINDKEAQVRKYIIRCLSIMPDSNTLKILMPFIVDENVDVRVEVMKTLGAFNNDEAVNLLIMGLDDKEPVVRREAASSLGGRIGQKVQKALGRAVGDDAEIVRMTAIRSLSKNADNTSFDLIVQCFDDSCPKVRLEALFAIRHFETSKSLPYIIKMVSDTSDDVCAAAIWMLGQIATEEAVDGLIEVVLKDHRSQMRTFAAEHLGKIGSMKAVAPLRLSLKNADTKAIGIINNAICKIQAKNSRQRII